MYLRIFEESFLLVVGGCFFFLVEYFKRRNYCKGLEWIRYKILLSVAGIFIVLDVGGGGVDVGGDVER